MVAITTVRANRYAGPCHACHNGVPAGTGLLERGPSGWQVSHHPGACPPAAGDQPERRSQPAECGVYLHDGRLFVVREFTPQYEDRKVRFAREIADLRKTQGDRLSEAGEHVRYEEIKAPRMAWQLRDDELVPMDELSRLGIQFGHCLVCGTRLEVAKSIERGIGPVCAGRQQARLAAAA